MLIPVKEKLLDSHQSPQGNVLLKVSIMLILWKSFFK